MSEAETEEIEHELHTQLTTLRSVADRIGKMVIALIFGAFGLGGWVALIEFRQQADDSTRNKVEDLQMWRERTLAQDVPNIISRISTSLTDQDKRLQRVEDKTDDINQTLDRIEASLTQQHNAAANSNPGGKP